MTTGGGGQGPVVTTPPPEPFNTIKTSWRRSHDGETASRVSEYLGVHASGGPWQPDFTWSHPPGLVRFASPPIVRLAEGATDREWAATVYAVALINRALPYDHHLTIGPDAPAGAIQQQSEEWRAGRGFPGIPDGQLFVEFFDHRPAYAATSAIGFAALDLEHEYDSRQGRLEKKRVRASAALMEREHFRSRPDRLAVSRARARDTSRAQSARARRCSAV